MKLFLSDHLFFCTLVFAINVLIGRAFSATSVIISSHYGLFTAWICKGRSFYRLPLKEYFMFLVDFTCVVTRDEFELELSNSSKPELWKFRAKPSRAGALQFSSWNRTEIFSRTIIKFPNFYQYHDYNQFKSISW